MKRKVQCAVLFHHWYDMLGMSNWETYKIIVMYGDISVDLHLENVYHGKNSYVRAILELLENNHFYVTTISAFESTFYNINFIDVDNYKTYRFSTK